MAGEGQEEGEEVIVTTASIDYPHNRLNSGELLLWFCETALSQGNDGWFQSRSVQQDGKQTVYRPEE